jgi:hypothetical protein
MFQLFSSISQGMFLVNRAGRIVWINDGYKRFLPDLGFSSVDQFVGHMVEDVVPNTQMRRVLETGQAILIDLLTNKAGTFVVSRIPLARRKWRADWCHRHRAVRPPRDHLAAADQQVCFAAARSGRGTARTGQPAPSQVHLCQFCRDQPGGGRGQTPGASRRPVVQPGSAAG